MGVASGLGNDCAFELNGKCFTAPFAPTPISRAKCEELKGELGIKGCYWDSDYWAGAVKQCGGVSKMPTMADLGKLATELYKEHPSVGAKQNIRSGLTLDTSKASAMGFTGSFFYVWSGEKFEESSVDDYAFLRLFASSHTFSMGSYRKDSGGAFQAVCVAD